MAQQELRLAAAAKFSRAAEMLFTRAGYEQASSEAIARYRAARLADAYRGAIGRVADLCCGIGGDLIALAGAGDVLAVDRDEAHASIALHNAAVYGLADRVTAVVSDVRDVRLTGLAAVFIDPARRSGRRPPRLAPPGWLGPPVPRRALRAAARLVRRADEPGSGGLREGRTRTARRPDTTGLGGRVHRRGPGPQGGGALVPCAGHRSPSRHARAATARRPAPRSVLRACPAGSGRGPRAHPHRRAGRPGAAAGAG